MKLITIATTLLLAAGCNLETAGLPRGPTTWLAELDCGADGDNRTLHVGETVETDDEWSCIVDEPRADRGSVTCWRDEAWFLLVADCRPGNRVSQAQIGDCMVRIQCGGGQL